MGNFRLPTNILSSAATEKVVNVELKETQAKAKVTREGYSVPAVQVNDQQLGFYIGQLIDVDVKALPRVISQSIKPGTKVAPGTAVDLILSPKSSVPFDIFDKTHADLKGKALTVVDPVIADPKTRETLLKYETPDKVSAQEKAALILGFNAVGIQIDDTSPDRNFDTAFNTVRNAVAFQ